MSTRMGAMLMLSTLLALSSYAKAQDTPDCTPSLVTLAPCLGFVQGKGDLPSVDCCKALGPVINNTPVCLCLLIGYGNGTGTTLPATFNQTIAKELPARCNLKANEDKCPALVGGAPTPPTSSPGASGPAPPPTAGGPSDGSGATLVSSMALVLSSIFVAFLFSFE